MKLYFLRHAEALDGTDDAARPLSPKGRQQARVVGRFLEDLDISLQATYSSPLVRARQTAEIVVDVLGSAAKGEIAIVNELLNGVSDRQFEGWLRSLPEASHLLFVGHEPSLSSHVRALVGIKEEEGFSLSKGAIACVETNDGRSGRLRFLIGPKHLRD